MSQAAIMPLALVAAGFVLYGVSYAFRNERLKRGLQVLAVIAEVAAVVVAVASIGALIGSGA